MGKSSECGQIANEKENREYKDSLFVDLFYTDVTSVENLLSLYNALHGTSLKDEGLIRKIKIDNILYKNFRNDISFEVEGRVIVFGEHQSTVNPNMPLRCLMYAGRAYEQLVDDDARYRSTMVKIDTPEFYTFYNGTQDFPVETELSLSDAFFDPDGKNSLELKVKVININTDKGHEILNKCEVLRQYSVFVDTVKRYRKDKVDEPIKKAIDECIRNGIMTDYLKRKGSEVRNMLTAEYSYEQDIRVKQFEAQQEGKAMGIIDIGIDCGLSRQEILSKLQIKLNVSFEEAQEYLKMFENGDSKTNLSNN